MVDYYWPMPCFGPLFMILAVAFCAAMMFMMMRAWWATAEADPVKITMIFKLKARYAPGEITKAEYAKFYKGKKVASVVALQPALLPVGPYPRNQEFVHMSAVGGKPEMVNVRPNRRVRAAALTKSDRINIARAGFIGRWW